MVGSTKDVDEECEEQSTSLRIHQVRIGESIPSRDRFLRQLHVWHLQCIQ